MATIKRSQGRCSRNGSRDHGGRQLPGSLPTVGSVCFLTQPMTTCPGVVVLCTVHWAFPQQPEIQLNSPTDMPSGQADGGHSSTEALPFQVTLVYQIGRNKLTSTGSDPPCRQPRVCTIVRTGGRLHTYVVIVLRFLQRPLSTLGLSVKNVTEDLGQ